MAPLTKPARRPFSSPPFLLAAVSASFDLPFPQHTPNLYGMDFLGICANYDFMRSVRPRAPLFDSELHVLSTVDYRSPHYGTAYMEVRTRKGDEWMMHNLAIAPFYNFHLAQR